MNINETGSYTWPDEKPLSKRAVLLSGIVLGFWLGILVSSWIFG